MELRHYGTLKFELKETKPIRAFGVRFVFSCAAPVYVLSSLHLGKKKILLLGQPVKIGGLVETSGPLVLYPRTLRFFVRRVVRFAIQLGRLETCN